MAGKTPADVISESCWVHKRALMSNQTQIRKDDIPSEVLEVISVLENGGYEAYLVGGCVRDLVLGRIPKDWDVTTDATPEQIQALFPKTVYENAYGTVAVVTEETTDMSLKVIEVTPYRLESDYKDNRHPEKVLFSKDILDDLKRRDFTMNALAYNPSKGQLLDEFGGFQDLKDKAIRTVGKATDRFEEDALRMLRAVRFSTQLGFTLSSETMAGITSHAPTLEHISKERIRDEFEKIILSPEPMIGIGLLEKLELLKYVIPELLEAIGCEQGGAHKFDVYEHLLQALQHASDKGWSLEIRLAALFHDIGKPKSRRASFAKATAGQAIGKRPYTFYGHEVIGARMAQKIMERLKFPKKVTDLVVTLVRQHMFFSDTETITLSAVRRVVQKVGSDHIWDLMNIRECDRVGMAKVEAPYRLRKYHAMIEQVLRDPISVGQLAIDGNDLRELGITPGPRMGWILHALLEEVLDDPKKNSKENLSELVRSLNALDDDELKALGERGKHQKDTAEQEELDIIHKRHGVK